MTTILCITGFILFAAALRAGGSITHQLPDMTSMPDEAPPVADLNRRVPKERLKLPQLLALSRAVRRVH